MTKKPCPDCAHTRHPGLYLGAGLGPPTPCQTCNGKAVVEEPPPVDGASVHRFKLGDRVRSVLSMVRGTVIGIDYSQGRVRVQTDDGSDVYYRPEYLTWVPDWSAPAAPELPEGWTWEGPQGQWGWWARGHGLAHAWVLSGHFDAMYVDDPLLLPRLEAAIRARNATPAPGTGPRSP